MPLQFRPYGEGKEQKTKEQALLEPLAAAVSTIPELYANYKKRRMEQDLALEELKMKRRQFQSEYGTGEYQNIAPGQLVSAPPPTAGPEEQMFGFEATPPTFTEETEEQKIQRLGTKGYEALNKAEMYKTKTEKQPPLKQQAKVTDKGVVLSYNPAEPDPEKQFLLPNGEYYDSLNPDHVAEYGRVIIGSNTPMLPAQQNVDISEIDAARNQLRDLVSSAESSGFGKGNPYVEAARASKFNPLQLIDPKAQKFKQMVAATKQIIGKGLEGGVLRAEDEKKYENIIPKAGDSEDILKTKAAQLDRLLAQRQKERIEGFSQAGFRGIPKAEDFAPIGGENPSVPEVGSMFQGAKVLRVKRIE